jgi:hypothetical protein
MFGIEHIADKGQFNMRSGFEEVGEVASGGYPSSRRDAEGVEHFL